MQVRQEHLTQPCQFVTGDSQWSACVKPVLVSALGLYRLAACYRETASMMLDMSLQVWLAGSRTESCSGS